MSDDHSWIPPASRPAPGRPPQQPPPWRPPGPAGPGGPPPPWHQPGPYSGSYGGRHVPPRQSAPKPGIIPLRPLGLGDIFDGAITYIRRNPKATLGLAAIVSAISQSFLAVWNLLFLEQLAALEALAPTAGPAEVFGAMGGLLGGVGVASLLGWLATVVLSGLLTSVIGRSVFGEQVSLGQAWRLTRDRLLPLMGLVLAWLMISVGYVGLVAGSALLIGLVAGEVPAVLVGALVAVALLPLIFFITVKMTLAAPAIVLERRSPIDGIVRSFTLVRGDFWRVFGISFLAGLVAAILGAILSAPFGIAQAVLNAIGDGKGTLAVIGVIVAAIGGVLAGTVTQPFSAGVTALLYVDRRMRSEAFDLVLQTAALERRDPHSIDQLWDASQAVPAGPVPVGSNAATYRPPRHPPPGGGYHQGMPPR